MERAISLLTVFFLASTAQADVRVANTTVNLPAIPPSSSFVVENAFTGLSFSQPLCLRTPPGDTQRLFICEKGGDLELIPDVTATTPTKTTFLDVNAIVNARSGETFRTNSEMGLLAVAFHPDYANNGIFFTVYNVTLGGDGYQRLSRWHDPDVEDTVADTDSEEILLEMLDQANNHNGGDLHFGPDGYLYMSWGDEGSQVDALNNSQFIDKDFWSSITRIDIDIEPEDFTPADGTGTDDDSVRPNIHPAVKLYDGNPLYEVPADNEWVGATSFNGVAVDSADVRTEFFAVGFRNPWRMSFDSMTGELWVGDVGQGSREEVATVEPGSNHGWAWIEGDANGAKFNETINGASRTNATLTAPEWDYGHGSGQFQGNSVTGGVVYYGNRLASLRGKYIFSDYSSGNIWALERTGTPGSPDVVRIAGEGGIAGFGTDPSNGDVLMADLGGQIRRLVEGDPGETGFPLTLSATGVFANLTTLEPEAGVVPYQVNLPFWSDYAFKQRWFVIRNTVDKVGYSEHGVWMFPEGMIWIKHFELAMERGNPATRKRIETRFLVRNTDGVYGVSYKWNEEGTEAFLVSEAGEDIDLTIDTGNGNYVQTWHIPSHAECIICHTPQAGHALSFNTRQLNRDGTLGNANGNFLNLLFDCGYLDSMPADPLTLPRHVGPEETLYSLQARVRSYIDVNCAYCHQSPGTAPESWFGNHFLPLSQTGLINGMAASGVQHPEDRLVVPGNPDRSILLSRVAVTNGYTRMPSIATNELDQSSIQLITDWINQETPLLKTYTEWRIEQFGDANSSEGEPDEDPDGDTETNHSEWLAYTDPNDGASYLTVAFAADDTQVTVDVPEFFNRRVTAEQSSNLIDWSQWLQSTNDGVPRNPETNHVITGPSLTPKQFFRVLVEER